MGALRRSCRISGLYRISNERIRENEGNYSRWGRKNTVDLLRPCKKNGGGQIAEINNGWDTPGTKKEEKTKKSSDSVVGRYKTVYTYRKAKRIHI